MRIGVYTLGCKVNQYESTGIVSALSGLGHYATEQFEFADVYIINTCSVTSEADRKSRQMISRVRRYNKDAKIIIMGCSGENKPEAYLHKDNVIAVSGTGDKTKAAVAAISAYGGNNISDYVEQPAYGGSSRTRAYLKIQDGCNNFCSYCIVPYLRGRSRSRTIEEVVGEAKELALRSDEIVVTGINISDFKDGERGLKDLVCAMKDISSRKRLSSLECNVIDEKLLENMADSGFCDHFHLSLQSGSERILKNMNRHYAPEQFYRKIELIRAVFPYAGITTDVITGFPGEDGSAHTETVEFIRRAGFSDIHVFPYSKRQGTKAADMIQTDKEEVNLRADELSTIKYSLKDAFYRKNLGRTLKVYIEDGKDGCNCGYTGNYIKVFSSAPLHSFLSHKLCDIYENNGIKGEVNE